MDPFITDNLLELWRLERTACTVVCHVIGAGPPPGGWSGVEQAAQALEVQVEEHLCGPPPPAVRLRILVSLVAGARTAQAEPRLAGWLATPGARVVLLLWGDDLIDEDLGALVADERLVAFLRRGCVSPPPPGPGTLLLLLTETAAAAPTVAAAFSGINGAVIDVLESGQPVARLTVDRGMPRVFTGVRLERARRSRPPDAVLEADATILAGLLEGTVVPATLRLAGDDRGVVGALIAAGADLPDIVRARITSAGSEREGHSGFYTTHQ